MVPLVDDGEEESGIAVMRERRRSSFGLMQRAEEYVLKQPRSEMMFDKQRERHGLTRSFGTQSLSGQAIKPSFTVTQLELPQAPISGGQSEEHHRTKMCLI